MGYRIVIEMSAGVVQAVYAPAGADLLVTVFDHDEGEDKKVDTEALIKSETQGLEFISYDFKP